MVYKCYIHIFIVTERLIGLLLALWTIVSIFDFRGIEMVSIILFINKNGKYVVGKNLSICRLLALKSALH
jgi:hypothetical protein